MQTNPAVKVAVLTGLLFAATAARANPAFDVSLDTSSISGMTEEVVFQLIDGDGVVDNSLLLGDFSVGGGTVAGAPEYFGTSGVSGDLSGGISMDDSGGSAVFGQLLTFGSSLSFQLTTTNNFSGSGAPDAFSMALLTPDLMTCLSDDQVSCVLLQLDLTGGTLSPSSFTLNGASAPGLPAPVVTVAETVPEPGSLALSLMGIMSLAIVWRTRS